MKTMKTTAHACALHSAPHNDLPCDVWVGDPVRYVVRHEPNCRRAEWRTGGVCRCSEAVGTITDIHWSEDSPVVMELGAVSVPVSHLLGLDRGEWTRERAHQACRAIHDWIVINDPTEDDPYTEMLRKRYQKLERIAVPPPLRLRFD